MTAVKDLIGSVAMAGLVAAVVVQAILAHASNEGVPMVVAKTLVSQADGVSTLSAVVLAKTAGDYKYVFELEKTGTSGSAKIRQEGLKNMAAGQEITVASQKISNAAKDTWTARLTILVGEKVFADHITHHP